MFVFTLSKVRNVLDFKVHPCKLVPVYSEDITPKEKLLFVNKI